MATAAIVLWNSGLAMAQETEPDQWEFSATPYVWFTSLEGEVASIRGLPPADVDASFSDLWENLDFTFMGNFQAQRGRFGVTVDLMYFDLSADGDGPTANFSRTEIDLKAFVGTFAPSYRAVEEDSFDLDVLAGARLWFTDTELTLRSGTVPNLSDDEKEAWVDPLVGVRGVFSATDNVSVRGYADIGGFGVSSDITYQLFAGVGYAFSDWITAEAGYRILKVDYADDGYLLNATFAGPIVGARFSF